MKTIILAIVTIVIATSNIHAEDESNTHITFQKGAIYSCIAISKANVQDPGNILKYNEKLLTAHIKEIWTNSN